MPVHARIPIVSEGTPHTPREVRGSYNRLRPLEKITGRKTRLDLDVLQVVQSLDKLEITLADVYAYAEKLAKLHPTTPMSATKSAQQLQVLRDSASSPSSAMLLPAQMSHHLAYLRSHVVPCLGRSRENWRPAKVTIVRFPMRHAFDFAWTCLQKRLGLFTAVCSPYSLLGSSWKL